MAINQLPNEILTSIFYYLDYKDLSNISLVCKRWNNIAEADYLWKKLCMDYFDDIDNYDCFFTSTSILTSQVSVYKKIFNFIRNMINGYAQIKSFCFNHENPGNIAIVSMYEYLDFVNIYIHGMSRFISYDISLEQIKYSNLQFPHDSLSFKIITTYVSETIILILDNIGYINIYDKDNYKWINYINLINLGYNYPLIDIISIYYNNYAKEIILLGKNVITCIKYDNNEISEDIHITKEIKIDDLKYSKHIEDDEIHISGDSLCCIKSTNDHIIYGFNYSDDGYHFDYAILNSFNKKNNNIIELDETNTLFNIDTRKDYLVVNTGYDIKTYKDIGSFLQLLYKINLSIRSYSYHIGLRINNNLLYASDGPILKIIKINDGKIISVINNYSDIDSVYVSYDGRFLLIGSVVSYNRVKYTSYDFSRPMSNIPSICDKNVIHKKKNNEDKNDGCIIL